MSRIIKASAQNFMCKNAVVTPSLKIYNGLMHMAESFHLSGTIPINNTNVFYLLVINLCITICMSLAPLTPFSHNVISFHIAVSLFTGFFKNVTPANGKGLLQYVFLFKYKCCTVYKCG